MTADAHSPIPLDDPDVAFLLHDWTCPDDQTEHWPERAWYEDSAEKLYIECGHCGFVSYLAHGCTFSDDDA